ncbi:MAG: TonB-dependent siderophore receptor [Myxococcota bacterium]
MLALVFALPQRTAAAPKDASGAREGEFDGVETIYVIGERAEEPRYHVPEISSPTRTATPIEEIPQSITVIPRDLLDDQQVVTIAEALRNSSSVVASNPLLTPAFDNTRIRGFPAEQLVDGFTQYYNPGDRDSTVNIERIEVLKGTNGLLYGGGSGSPVGGVVNIVSKKPTDETAGEVGLTVGSFEYYQPYFDFNQPIAKGVLLRLTGAYASSGSQIDVIQTERFNVNPTLRLEIGPKTSITMRAKISRWRQPDYQGLSATGTVRGTIDVDRFLFIGPRHIDDSTSEFYSGSIALEHDFGPVWSGSIQARYSRSRFEENVRTIVGAGFDFGADRPIIEPPSLAESVGFGLLPFGLFDGRLFQEQKEVSTVANATATFDTGPIEHTLLFGADFSRYDDSGYINVGPVGGSLITTVDLANPSFPEPFVAPGPGIKDNFVTNTVAGGYVQLQSTLFERVHALAGVRAGFVEIDFESPGDQNRTRSVRPIPRVGAVVDVVEGLSLFAGYSEGMRGQPFAIFVTKPEPQRSRQIEGGLKIWWNDRLTGHFAYYEIDRQNVAVPTPDPARDGGFGSVPEGKQHSSGYELEIRWSPWADLSVLASYGWTKTGFSDDLFAFASKGDDLPGIPEHAGRVWVQYALPAPFDEFELGTGLQADSGSRISLRNDFESDPHFTLDATANYETDRYRLGLSVKNLSDERYFERLNYLGGRVSPGQGRAIFATIALRY